MSRPSPAELCLHLVALGLFATGVLYMFHGSPMPYHLDAMQADWADIPPQQRVVITAIQRGSASGLLAGGVAISMLTLFGLRDGSGTWARWCILLIGMIEILPAIYSVLQVKARTQGDPPLAVLLVFAGLVIVGVLGLKVRADDGRKDLEAPGEE